MRAEIGFDGVRAPSAKELDGVLVYSSAQEGGGPSWSEAGGRHQGVVDACFGLNGTGR